MDWNWKVFVNLLVALVFLAVAWYLFRQDSFFAVGKRDPSTGRLFAGASLRWLIASMVCGAAFALSWVWWLGRAVPGGFFGNVPGGILLVAAVVCLVLAFQKGRQVPTPGTHAVPAAAGHAPAAGDNTRP